MIGVFTFPPRPQLASSRFLPSPNSESVVFALAPTLLSSLFLRPFRARESQSCDGGQHDIAAARRGEGGAASRRNGEERYVAQRIQQTQTHKRTDKKN